VTTKRQPKITEEDTTIYANTLTNTNRQQTRTKMGQPPHERTNHGDFHTHRQMKIKIKIDKNTDQHGQGKDTKQKTRKRIEQNWSLEFFFTTEHISSKIDQ
jgi:hypothetical protein